MIEHILEHKSWSWFIISQQPQKPWCTVCRGWGSPWGRLVSFVFLKAELKMSDFFKEDINTVVNEIGQVFNLFLIIQKYDRILWKSISSLPEGDQNCFSSQGGHNHLCFPQTSYLSPISQIISVEKILSCGEISDFCKEFEQFMEFYRNLCRFCSKFV